MTEDEEKPKYISTYDPERPISEMVLEQGFHSKGSLILKQRIKLQELHREGNL